MNWFPDRFDGNWLAAICLVFSVAALINCNELLFVAEDSNGNQFKFRIALKTEKRREFNWNAITQLFTNGKFYSTLQSF